MAQNITSIKSISLITGDSYSSIISSPTLLSVLGITEFGANWEAEMVIRKSTIRGTITLSKVLSKTADNTSWLFDITPTESAILTDSQYFLSIEVRDLVDNNFRKEVLQAKLSMATSGVAN